LPLPLFSSMISPDPGRGLVFPADFYLYISSSLSSVPPLPNLTVSGVRSDSYFLPPLILNGSKRFSFFPSSLPCVDDPRLKLAASERCSLIGRTFCAFHIRKKDSRSANRLSRPLFPSYQTDAISPRYVIMRTLRWLQAFPVDRDRPSFDFATFSLWRHVLGLQAIFSLPCLPSAHDED